MKMAAGHSLTSVRKAVRDVSTKPEILDLARRHATLGSLGRMIGEAFALGRSRRS